MRCRSSLAAAPSHSHCAPTRTSLDRHQPSQPRSGAGHLLLPSQRARAVARRLRAAAASPPSPARHRPCRPAAGRPPRASSAAPSWVACPCRRGARGRRRADGGCGRPLAARQNRCLPAAPRPTSALPPPPPQHIEAALTEEERALTTVHLAVSKQLRRLEVRAANSFAPWLRAHCARQLPHCSTHCPTPPPSPRRRRRSSCSRRCCGAQRRRSTSSSHRRRRRSRSRRSRSRHRRRRRGRPLPPRPRAAERPPRALP